MINANVYFENVSNSNVIAGNNNFINYDKIDELLDDIKKSIIDENLKNSHKQETIEVVEDLKESISRKKKPCIIKNALMGLKKMLMDFGSNVTVKLIEDKANSLW